jgi:hypothetical protein
MKWKLYTLTKVTFKTILTTNTTLST